jgi:hypothetical protein
LVSRKNGHAENFLYLPLKTFSDRLLGSPDTIQHEGHEVHEVRKVDHRKPSCPS